MVYEDAQGGGEDKGGRRAPKREQAPVASMPAAEKTTLGDIEELAALKEQLDQKAIDALNKKEAAKAEDVKEAETDSTDNE